MQHPIPCQSQGLIKEIMHLLERLFRLGSSRKVAVRNDLGGELSYVGLLRAAGTVAEGLKGLKGGSVGILCKDPIQMAVGIYSAWLSKKAAVPLHYSYPLAEIEHRMRVSKCEVILCDNSDYPELYNYNSKFSKLKIDSLLDNHVEKEDRHKFYNLDFESMMDSPALILFTSGTTGKPKGVLHTFSTLSAQIQDLHHTWKVSDCDEFFLALPMNHIHGLVTGMLNGIGAGACLTLHSRFDAKMAWERLQDQRTTFFTAVPSIYTKLLNYYRSSGDAGLGRLDHLRVMVSGSSPLSEPLLEGWRESIRSEGIVERYGMTETGMICTNRIGSIKPGYVGKPFPSIDLKIVKNGEEDASNDTSFGRVQVRGPGLFKGYLDSDNGGLVERDCRAFFDTGDRGYLDEFGDLKLVGRERDILKVSGYKVGAGEIESAVMNFGGCVRECVVLGLEDAREIGNQVIAALVVVDEDDLLRDRAGLIQRLKKHLSMRLAHYKIPRRWVIRGEGIPCNLIGKPDHFRIRELFNKGM